jgi:NAD(P)H-hydrate epimerase
MATDRTQLRNAGETSAAVELEHGPAGRKWLEPLYGAREMRALDAWAIEERGVPSLELMEKAGARVAAAVSDLHRGGPVRIACGKGNNGGDGLVAGRKLGEMGVRAEVLLLAPPGELSDDARVNYDKLLAAGGTVNEVDPPDFEAALAESAAVVDALLGTGFTGAPRPPLDEVIDAINGAGAPVVAVDVPSGVDASNGEVAGACVRADATVTFHGAKVGLWIRPGKGYAGRVQVAEIGVPAGNGSRPPVESGIGLIDSSVLDLLPRRGADSTKFKSGSVLVIGGSTGLTGAVCLAADAAMRAGAGWVRAAVPRSLNAIFEQKLTEVMTVPMPDVDGFLEGRGVDGALEAAGRAQAVVLGPGLGRSEHSFEVARALVRGLDRPVVVDADGLNALADGGLETLARRKAPAVLTPHAGELARLMGVDSEDVSRHRLQYAREAAARSRSTVVLKGDDSLVVEAGGGPVGVSGGGTPALATAGTGDVLSGMIAAFLAKGLAPFEAACAGVLAHADAGRGAAMSQGVESVIASDVIAAIPAVLRDAGG